jgi:hypothetical protein
VATTETMLLSVHIVAARDDIASSPEKPDSQVAPVFDWRESPVTDRRYLWLRPQGRGAKCRLGSRRGLLKITPK